jgi:hypothetical protein
VSDSRIAQALQDVKAGAAAIDDARTLLGEWLDEGPHLSELDVQALWLNRDALSKLLKRVDAVAGSLARIEDRMEVHR